MSSWQVFGLAGILFARLPSSDSSQCQIGRSFLLTAAGQFRVLTGFPSSPCAGAQGTTKQLNYNLGTVKEQAPYMGPLWKCTRNLNEFASDFRLCH
jgi:hypothetical protein